MFYHLDKINVPVNFFAGKQDMLSHPIDVLTMTKKLITCPKIWLKFYKAGHYSFLWGNSMRFYGDLFDIL